MQLRFMITFYFRLRAALFVALIFAFALPALADPPSTNQSYNIELQLAQDAAANQDFTTAFNDYLLASSFEPGETAAKSAALAVLEHNTPSSIDLSTLSKSVNTGLAFDIIVQQTEAGSADSDYKTAIIVPNDPVADEIDDPVESWPFGRAVYIYSSQDGQKASLLCTLHYQAADYTALAERTGALLSVLDDVYAQRMQIARADDSSPFHVWLCSTAPVSSGGEQWRNNIYFYDVGDERSSIEWIREIAHEFSHLAFPAVGGTYTDPEAFANGYLGERLLVRWLERGAAGGRPTVEAAWKGTFEGYPNFARLLITPSLSAFSAHGLNKNDLAQLNADGMRYLIGMMLTVDDDCGSAKVGALLQGLADQHSTDPNLLYAPVKQALALSGKLKHNADASAQ